VIIGVGAIGCIPGFIIRKPNFQDCNEDVNQKVKPFTNKLPMKIQELKSQLPGSLFTIMDTFKFFKKIRNTPEKFGELIINFSNCFLICHISFLLLFLFGNTLFF
jgi:hypothetical protein